MVSKQHFICESFGPEHNLSKGWSLKTQSVGNVRVGLILNVQCSMSNVKVNKFQICHLDPALWELNVDSFVMDQIQLFVTKTEQMTKS